MTKHTHGPVRFQALAGDHQHAATASGMGGGKKRVECAMGLFLGAMVEIDPTLDPKLAASQFDQRPLVEAWGNSMAQFRLWRRSTE